MTNVKPLHRLASRIRRNPLLVGLALFIGFNIIALLSFWAYDHPNLNATIVAIPKSTSTQNNISSSGTTFIPTAAGSESAAPTTATTTDTSVPMAPTGLSGVATSDSSVSLTWNYALDPDGKVNGYDVIRNGLNLGIDTGRRYVDTAVKPDSTYFYTLKTIGTNGAVSASSIVEVQTPPVFDATVGTGFVSPAPPSTIDVNTYAQFNYPVTANTAGSLTYQIITSTGYILNTGTLSFSGAGTQTISQTIWFNGYWNSLPSQTLKVQLQILKPITLDSNSVSVDFNNPWD